MSTVAMLDHPIPPVFDAHSRVLVLGSFPSPASRKLGFNYGHPANRFWRVMSELFDEPLANTNERKRDQVLRHHIALWDVAKSCTIEGASDSTIRNVVPNDFSQILDAASIEAVFCTGAKSAQLYRRYCEKTVGMPCVQLPSTSPANAAAGLPALVEAYGTILPYLHEYVAPVLDVPGVVALEQAVAKQGTSLAELMERAGRALVRKAAQLAGPGSFAVVLCGSGNNGGDGWVAARELSLAGYAVCLITPMPVDRISSQPAHDAAAASEVLLLDAGGEVLCKPEVGKLARILDDADIVLDCMLGTGFDGDAVKEPYATWIRMANKARKAGAVVLSADVPSGVSAQTGRAAVPHVVADHTLTMIASKPGLACRAAGRVQVAPLAYIEPLLAS